MGDGQYGLAGAADYYFGRSLASFTVDDADKTALLAGAIKSARYYAPTGSGIERVRQRRNQVPGLMMNRRIAADAAQALYGHPRLTNAHTHQLKRRSRIKKACVRLRAPNRGTDRSENRAGVHTLV
jgi:membrane peptidoglycan carboxypeptidase